MEKENLSSFELAKRNIWEYIKISLILGIVYLAIIRPVIGSIKVQLASFIVQMVAIGICIVLSTYITTNNLLRKYDVSRSDVSIIIKIMGVFFALIVILNSIYNVNEFKDRLQDVVERYEKNEEMFGKDNYYNKDTLEEIHKAKLGKIKKDFFYQTGCFMLAPIVYNTCIYLYALFLEKKWLLNEV